jgi:zinc protease
MFGMASMTTQAQGLVPIDPATTFGTLSNGMTYYIRPNARPENRAELRLVVRAGSVLEDDDQQGLAHFVEHMAFNGTKNFKKQELVNYLESIGVKFGPHLNAYTSFDETVYMLQVPTDSTKQLETAFQILEDWAHGLAFDHTEMDKERGVVIEEWRLSRGAWARMDDKTFPILFKGSHYADRLPIGKKEIVETAPYDAAKRFYRDWYRPDLMSVIAVGDFDKGKIEQLINRHFAGMKNPEKPRERTFFPIPDHDETLTAIAQDREATMSNVNITYKHPRSQYKTEDDFRQKIVESLFSGMIRARLDEMRTQGDPPFAFAFAGRNSETMTKDFFDLTAYTQPNKVLRSLEVLATEAERVRQYGFEASELERMKVQMQRRLERSLAERDKTESDRLVWSYVSHALGKAFLPGVEAEYALGQKYLPGITLDEVNRLSTQLITRKNRVISVHAPEKDGMAIPSGDEMLAVISKIEKGAIAKYQDNVSTAPLLVPPTAKATIVSETTSEETRKLGILDWKLSNGVRVIVKPTNFKNDEILVRAYSPGGTSLASDASYDAVDNVSGIFSNAGVGEFDRATLTKKLTGKVAYVNTYVSELYEGVRGSASPKDLETMMQLLHLRFTAVRPDSGAFNSHKTMMETFVANSENDPESLMQDTMSVTMSQYHPRRKPTNSQSLAKMDLMQSYNFYRDRFADAGDFTFVFVGNVDPVSFKQLALTYLGTLPSNGRKENWRDVGVKNPTGVI